MKKFLIALVCSMGLASMTYADSLEPFKNQKGQIDIAGGTAHIPVMKGAAQKIMAVNPNVRITITGGGSGVGVQKVGEGLVQIGNTGRALKSSEIEKYGLVSFPFAIDGVAICVNPKNPVLELSKEQLIGIFTGKIKNWSEVGGADAAISLYAREDGSGTRDTFESLATDEQQTTASANIINSNGAMKTAISQDPNGIGYVGIGHLDQQVKGVVLDGMVPSQENAANGSYKITRLLYMNTKGQPTGLLKAFIDYIYSEDGSAIIQASGYIPAPRQ